MSKKNPILAAVLGFIVFGIFYSAGLKRGLMAFSALCLLSWFGASILGSVEMSCIANVTGAYLGYKWADAYNEEGRALTEVQVQQ